MIAEEELESLRNATRAGLAEALHQVSLFYEELAKTIKNGGILTDTVFDEMNKTGVLATVPFKGENISLSYLFSKDIEGELKE